MRTLGRKGSGTGGVKTVKLTQIEIDAIDSALRDYIFRGRDRVVCTKSNGVLLSAFDKFKRYAR